MADDKIYRPKEIEIAGEKVKFLKLKSRLLSLGVVDKNGIRFSDVEKTLLDFAYVFRYRSLPEEKIISTIHEYGKNLDKKKIRAYLRLYPKSIEKVIEKYYIEYLKIFVLYLFLTNIFSREVAA